MSSSLLLQPSSWTPSQKSEFAEEIKFRWSLNARPSQLIPAGDWTVWLIKAGRGFGKTRCGAEAVRIWKDKYPIIHFVGATASDARDIMVEGESGILRCSPPWDMPKYEPSKRKLTWKNGSHALIFTADEPDRLRGPQCHAAWCDEIAAWRYGQETWDMLMMGLRLGTDPRVIATTTPRPTTMIKDLLKDPNTRVTSGNNRGV